MSPPAPEQVDAALAALTGTVTEERPEGDFARNMLRLKLVTIARQRNVPWAAIGQAMGGISGKAAKREVKHLARVTQRQLLAAKSAHPPAHRPFIHEMAGGNDPSISLTVDADPVPAPPVRPEDAVAIIDPLPMTDQAPYKFVALSDLVEIPLAGPVPGSAAKTPEALGLPLVNADD